MFKIAIVEDDEKASKILQGYILRFQEETEVECECTWFVNGFDFLEYQEKSFDLVLMDIEMPHMNGLEVAGKMREKDNHTSLIFVTNMAKYALKGYEVDALDFLVKPVGYFNFSLKLKKAIHIAERKTKSKYSILVKGTDGIERIYIDDIYYIEVSGHNVTYVTRTGKWTERITLKKCEENLPQTQFARCNNCYLVNFQYVQKITDKYVLLQNQDWKTELAMSQPRKKEFMNRFTQYIRG